MTYCPSGECLCCVCVLRVSAEFGEAFTAGDPCCPGCHADMAAADWPGLRCSTTPASPATFFTTTNTQGDHHA